MAKTCANCGARLDSGLTVCPRCGAEIQNSRSADPSRPGYASGANPLPRDGQNAAPARKSKTGLCIFLLILMLAEFCVAGFKYPGFFWKIKGYFPAAESAGEETKASFT